MFASNQSPFHLLKTERDAQFDYVMLSERFDVSLNVIRAKANVETHVHSMDVYNLVIAGEILIRRGDQSEAYGRGDWIHIPAHQPHAVETKEEVTLLELWSKSGEFAPEGT